MRILIVDDQATNRLILARHLKRWNYQVLEATNGAEAWEIIQRENINLVITDWMMPQMNGAELVRAIRSADLPHYVYVILLTSQSNISYLVEGMEAGADDFIVKPFNEQELRVRLRAGERILSLEHELADRNTKLIESNRKLSDAYGVISKDLEAAGKMQKSLLPGNSSTINGFCFEWLFLPSKFIAGDILNFFKLDEDHIAFYLLDVAGHGIPSAMLSVTLSKILTPVFRESDDTMRRFIPGTPDFSVRSPAEVLHELNERFQTENDAMQYFTIIYGVLELHTGKIRFSQAGHPAPIHVPVNGSSASLGAGGFPVGMLPDMEYDECELTLEKGDRLIIYSDGITECSNPHGELFGEERLRHLVGRYRGFPLTESVRMGERYLQLWHGGSEFDDDVTLLAIERCV